MIQQQIKMMNEYLCRNYLSEQIVSEMRSTRIRRRLGNPANKSDKYDTLANTINFSRKNNLLEDEGSSNYQEWLKKSTTLQDIYRHYDSAQSRESTESGRDAEELNEDFDGHITGYGYQQNPTSNSPSKLGHSGSGGGYSYGYPSSGMHVSGGGPYGYGGGGSYFGGHSGPVLYGEGGSGHSGHGFSSHEHTAPKYHGDHDDKDKLTDLFDIALTALAYLSFGMFIIQVIMCISMANTTTAPVMTMMPMSMSPTNGGMTGDGMMGGGSETLNEGYTNDGGTTGGDNGMGSESIAEGTAGEGTGEGTTGDGDSVTGGGDGGYGGTTGGRGDGGTEGNYGNTGGTGDGTGDGMGGTGDTGGGRDAMEFRNKRDIPTITQPNSEALNELARRILISIEAALVAHQDDGNCLRKTLCENNLYSRNLESNQKYWIPVWSLGMSWLSGRLVENVPSTTSMLDTLKASLLGLGKADCELMYHDCDMRKERQKRRRRRRKRSNN